MSQEKFKGMSSSSHIMHFYVLSYVTVFTMIELHCVTQGIGLLLKLNPKIEHQPFNQHFRLEPAETIFSEILMEIHNFNKKTAIENVVMKMASFCLGLNMLIEKLNSCKVLLRMC